MKKFNTLFNERKNIRKQEQKMGLHGLSEREKTVLEYIASRDSTTITNITKESFFLNYSLSTIKRAVLTLKQNELVTHVSTGDGREFAMVLNKAKVK